MKGKLTYGYVGHKAYVTCYFLKQKQEIQVEVWHGLFAHTASPTYTILY